MSGNAMQRGYDDTTYLTEMAAGLVSRKFNSVDEAAKAVLAEDGGSNVDRLRRKFREQGWYEKGLAAHVEAEIKRRGLVPEAAYLKVVRRALKTTASPGQSVVRAWVGLQDRYAKRPATSLVTFSLATTLLIAAAASGAVSISTVLVLAVICCVGLLTGWTDRTSETASPRLASIHLGLMSIILGSLITAFGYIEPDPLYTMGSAQGALTATIGFSLIGVYATSFIGSQTRRAGTRNSLEVKLLIASLAVLSQVGTALLLLDTSFPTV